MSIEGTSGSETFDRFRSALAATPSVRHELEGAMRLNVERVNPSDPGNRFVVGGAIEWLIAAAAWAVNVLTIPGGHSARGYDLMDLQNAARSLWSVKAQTSNSGSEWRITNGLGGSGGGFVDPTVFVSPRLPGLVFVDPQLHTAVSGRVKQKSDAVVLPFAAVRDHAVENPLCVADLKAPVNEGRGEENPFLAYAETLVAPGQFPRLSKMFVESRPPALGAAGEISELLQMKARGEISDEQFNALVNRIAGI